MNTLLLLLGALLTTWNTPWSGEPTTISNIVLISAGLILMAASLYVYADQEEEEK